MSSRLVARPLAVVIDTNVWLDLLVFDAPASRWLARLVLPHGVPPASPGGNVAAGIRAGGAPVATTSALQPIGTAPMRDELAHVLGRPRFALTEAQRRSRLDRYDGAVRRVSEAPDCRLACRDPDDRMFLDLAVRERCWLLSRDRALLAARRHALRRFGVRIGEPHELYEALGPAVSGTGTASGGTDAEAPGFDAAAGVTDAATSVTDVTSSATDAAMSVTDAAATARRSAA